MSGGNGWVAPNGHVNGAVQQLQGVHRSGTAVIDRAGQGSGEEGGRGKKGKKGSLLDNALLARARGGKWPVYG